jgi:hypothetical protein
MSTDTNNDTGFLSGLTDTVSVFFGSATITPTTTHVRWGAIIGLVAGWLLGIWRKTSKPEVGMLGF